MFYFCMTVRWNKSRCFTPFLSLFSQSCSLKNLISKFIYLLFHSTAVNICFCVSHFLSCCSTWHLSYKPTYKNYSRGCFIIIWSGLNFKISIVQKMYEWPSWYFAKVILQLGDHFGKKTAWSLIYFLNYAYFDI